MGNLRSGEVETSVFISGKYRERKRVILAFQLGHGFGFVFLLGTPAYRRILLTRIMIHIENGRTQACWIGTGGPDNRNL